MCAHAANNELFQSVYQGLDGAITGMAGRAGLTQNVCALAPGCLMLRAATFWQVGGMDAVCYPLVHFELDLCLRLTRSGFNNVWTPQAKLLNRQSQQEGATTAEVEESERFRDQWQRALDYDPSNNPNLALGSVWPTPAFPPRTDIPWLPNKTRHLAKRAMP
jgi:GT2 family glycosyltransferase